MKIRLLKPIPQKGRIIPAGTILSSAPLSYMQKLVADGRAVQVGLYDAPETPFPPSLSKDRAKPGRAGKRAPGPVATGGNGKGTRGVVRKHG